ncbi:phytase [Belliella kenyensis]|uniref:Phytase n=1 Tax=Belliella kenyensis TaxID=1472724 RepID=A0ABV8EJE8_9BACT|nr:phytase [Belliella kenyensis]MCH7400303.1 phytase [Belliella kenyensis]MDN3604679.1 phytase [Belliella kenyensis]
MKFNFLFPLFICSAFGCQQANTSDHHQEIDAEVIQPVLVSDSTDMDTDDPAIWINQYDPGRSLILGTDKDKNGGLYVFDLEGKIIDSLTIKNLKRPNNVDVGYQFQLNEQIVDFAVVTERMTRALRFYSLPDMKSIDGGDGIEVFQGEDESAEHRDLMGIATYKSPSSQKQYVIVGRKSGPTDGTYLWQYEMKADEGKISLDLVRKFGNYSGKKEIEAIAVDQSLGYVYYSDEMHGIRKYYADPEKGNDELAVFGRDYFTRDHEGISIYQKSDTTGYILVSDQQANKFHVFPREGKKDSPHDHHLIKAISLATESSDGSEVTHVALSPKFPKGLFVAMSEGRVFHYYSWEDLEKMIHK